MQYLIKSFLICILFLAAHKISEISGNNLEEITVSLDLLGMDIEDRYSELSNIQKDNLLHLPNARKNKIEIEKQIGAFIKEQSELLKNYDISNLEMDHIYQRKWEIFTKMGNYEMPTENWNELISYKNANEDLEEKLQISCTNKSAKCTLSKKDVLLTLSDSTNAKDLEYMWSKSQDIFSINRKKFPQFLKLVESAAKANGEENVKQYWEMLAEYPDAYEHANNLWNEIKPLYNKFHKFIKSRLEKHYEEISSESNSIPVYLLGNEFGTDWTNIAPLILPHRYLYDEITSMLEFEEIGGKKVYEVAEKFTVNMGLGKAGENFWKTSIFDHQCPSHLLTNSVEKYSFVVTCNSTKWINYLEAHEDMFQATLNNLNYPALSWSNSRLSALDEALISLSSILALKNLPLVGIVPEDVFLPKDDDESGTNSNQMSALMLVALRVLPRLPYYLLADTWRLKLLEDENEKTFNETVKSWWEHRESFQKVKGVTNTEFDFLGDDYIISNKPYIGKFFGTILQFQLLEHFQNEVNDGVNILEHIAKDESFKTLLKHRSIYEWPKALYDNLYYDVTSDSLLEYFRPLEEYMDEAPTEQITQTVRPKTTTTTTIKTTTQDLSAITNVITNDEPEKNSKTEDKNVKKSENILVAVPKVADKKQETPFDFLIPPAAPTKNNIPSDTKPEVASTNMTATWIGAAIGIATLSVIIFILAKKKCRRKPAVNNRRHEV